MLVNEIGEGQQGARSRSTPSELETLSSAVSQLRERSDAQSKQISSEMASRCQKSKSLLLPACLIRECTSVSDLSWMIMRRVYFQRGTLERGIGAGFVWVFFFPSFFSWGHSLSVNYFIMLCFFLIQGCWNENPNTHTHGDMKNRHFISKGL